MAASSAARYCGCGTRLARDNLGGRCGPCQVADRRQGPAQVIRASVEVRALSRRNPAAGTKAERAVLIREWRAQGRRWFEIAAEFQNRYGVNARAARRLARNWSQQHVAQLWCQRWPDDPKTHKNISYWEKWKNGLRIPGTFLRSKP